jgi:hypothetical protein
VGLYFGGSLKLVESIKILPRASCTHVFFSRLHLPANVEYRAHVGSDMNESVSSVVMKLEKSVERSQETKLETIVRS